MKIRTLIQILLVTLLIVAVPQGNLCAAPTHYILGSGVLRPDLARELHRASQSEIAPQDTTAISFLDFHIVTPPVEYYSTKESFIVKVPAVDTTSTTPATQALAKVQDYNEVSTPLDFNIITPALDFDIITPVSVLTDHRVLAKGQDSKVLTMPLDFNIITGPLDFDIITPTSVFTDQKALAIGRDFNVVTPLLDFDIITPPVYDNVYALDFHVLTPPMEHVLRNDLAQDFNIITAPLDFDILTAPLDTLDRSALAFGLDLLRLGNVSAQTRERHGRDYLKYRQYANPEEELIYAAPDSVVARPMFNARDYSLQKRFRPSDKTPYNDNDFVSATYVSVAGGATVPMISAYSYGPSLQFAVGHMFTKLHSAQISVEGGTHYDPNYLSRLNRAVVSATYMFNFTNYIRGYDKNRFCNVSLLGGLDLMYKWGAKDVQKKFNVGVHGGVEASMRILKHADMFVATTFSAFHKPESEFTDLNLRTFLPMFNGVIGARFYMGQEHWRSELPGLQWHFFAGSGVRMQASTFARNMSLGNSAGFQVFAGAGRHYTDVFDLRAKVEYARYNWAQSQNGMKLAANDVSLGVDGVLDMVALFSHRDDIPVNVSLVAGPRVGMFNKLGDSTIVGLKKGYFGAYAGVQVKAFVWNMIRVYVEPGVNLTPYSIMSNNGLSRNYLDAGLGVNVGVEFALPLK